MSFKVAPIIFFIMVGFFAKISIEGTMNAKAKAEQKGPSRIPTSQELRGNFASK